MKAHGLANTTMLYAEYEKKMLGFLAEKTTPILWADGGSFLSVLTIPLSLFLHQTFV